MTQALGMCGFTIGRASYFKQFDVVEVQQTFYDPPALATLARWRDEAPPGFQFAMKAWQVITHFGTSPTYRRLVSPFSESEREEAGGFRLTTTVLRAWEKTLECARALRATAILFQCPASFRPTDENIDAMRAFFETPSCVRRRHPTCCTGGCTATEATTHATATMSFVNCVGG